MQIKRHGLLFVLSSPSGAGKSTLARRLLESDMNISLSVSATTRPRRPSEIEGQDYYFVSPEKFDQMVERGELLEHATVFGNRYGSPREPVETALRAGRDVLFDVDWQGTEQLRKSVPEHLVSVFVLPPSIAALEQRLRTRAQDSEDVIQGRMAKAGEEIKHYQDYDYIILNEDLQRAFSDVRAILDAERLKRYRQTGLPDFVAGLLDELG